MTASRRTTRLLVVTGSLVSLAVLGWVAARLVSGPVDVTGLWPVGLGAGAVVWASTRWRRWWQRSWGRSPWR